MTDDESSTDDGGEVVDEVLQPPTEAIRPLTERLADTSTLTGDPSDSGESGTMDDCVGDGPVVEPMVAVYRHDLHKARMRSHADAAETFAGVRVNEPVPLGADRDAALLSRPDDEPKQTVANHASPLRISLLTGKAKMVVGEVDGSLQSAMRALMQITEPVAMHEAWLTSSIAGVFNESVYYPYTSLKFHTLLAAALLDNYRAGYGFDELFLVVDPPTGLTVTDDESSPGGGESGVVPHRTVVSTAEFALRITGEPGGRPAARLGPRPERSFAAVWSRLPEQPLDTDAERVWRVLDAQLRRIRSWSVALQYIEEFVAVGGAMSFNDPGDAPGTGGDDG